MKTVYIAGPMRGYPNFNFAAFDKAKALLESQGWYVISPADMDRQAGQGTDTSGVGWDSSQGPAGYDYENNRTFIRRDVGIIINRLRPENGDAVALLPGVENSVGASGEYHLARWAKLPFISALSGLPIDYADDVDYEWSMMQPAEFRSCCGGYCGTDSCGPAPSEERSMLAIAQRMADEPYPLPKVNPGTSLDDFGGRP